MRQKLQNLRLQSAYSFQPSKVSNNFDFQHGVHRSPVRFADTLAVGNSTAAGTLGLIRKQLASVGCPVWSEVFRPKVDGLAANNFQGAAIPRHVRLYFNTSDGGGDQVASRKSIKHHTLDSLDEIVIDLSCLLHSIALIVKTTLLRIDACLQRSGATWKYYSSLAMLVHLWRDLSKHIFSQILKDHDAVIAVKHYRRLMPKCIAGYHSTPTSH